MSAPSTIENLYCIAVPTPYPVGPVNCYLLDGPSPVLVDCGPGTAEAETALRAGLLERGITPADITTIVLTHHHPDHAGGLGWLRRETGATLLGHARNDYWLAGGADDLAGQSAFYTWLYQDCGVSIDVTEMTNRLADNAKRSGHACIMRALAEGDLVELGTSCWQILETPGHAGSSISLLRSDGVCLVGDTLLHRISSNALAEPGYAGEGRRHPSLAAYRRSLSRLAALDLTTIVPGHGPTFSGHAALIERRLLGQVERANRLRDLLDKRGSTVLALTQKLFPGLPSTQMFLGLSEVLGHLDLLEDGGLARHDGEQPAHYYPVASTMGS